MKWDRQVIIKNAQKFLKDNFVKGVKKYIQKIYHA